MSAPGLVAIGDNVVDCYLDFGHMYPGGNAVNVAVHASRLGVDASYIGVLGEDAAGAAILDSLRDEGVSVTNVRVLPGPNARALVRVVAGNRVFTGGDAGVSRFVPSQDDLDLIARAPITRTGECSMLEDQLPALARAAPRLSFDFSERPWSYVEELAGHADIAIASLPESDAARAEELAREIRRLGPAVVAVTRGAAGAVLLTDRLYTSVAGDNPIVDTLGAGDAFIARLLVGLLREENPRELVQAASVYATGACAEVGAFGHRTVLPQSLSLPPERSAAALHERIPQ